LGIADVQTTAANPATVQLLALVLINDANFFVELEITGRLAGSSTERYTNRYQGRFSTNGVGAVTTVIQTNSINQSFGTPTAVAISTATNAFVLTVGSGIAQTVDWKVNYKLTTHQF